MQSERIQQRINTLLQEADEAVAGSDWARVRDRAENVLAFDPENAEARSYLAAADRALPVGAVPLAAEKLDSFPHPGETERERTNVAASPSGRGRASDVSHAVAGGAAEVTFSQPVSFVEGRYQVQSLLGEGGKKRVYLAHDTKLDRDVAFALIKTDGLDDDGLTRIRREAQAMGRLGDHPHIVSVFDIGEEHGQPYLVSQLMAGGDVAALLTGAEHHKLALDETRRIGDEVAAGLEHAHARGVIHRDLKPGNVWLTEDGVAKIGDFGLAVALDRSRLTQAGMMVGTVSYMPPEQATGGEVTNRSDLYALGAMLYEMLCGRPPFIGDDSVAIIGQHLNTPPVAPTWHRPDCPPGLEALILRLLEKDPGKRPQSAAEVRTMLASVGSPSPGGEGVNYPPPAAGDAVAWGAAEGEAASPRGYQDPAYRQTFVGREHEVRELRSAFDAAASAHGSLVMVVGEPGIGKTALCEQLATYVGLRGGSTLVGHCYEEGSLSLPYLAFVEALRSYVLTHETKDLESELGSGAAEVARIISEVRDRVPVELRPPGDPEDDRWRLFQAVTGFLRNASAVQPILIVLEDLHWADRGTLDYLVHLSRNLAGARLLVVGTYRDVEVDRSHPLSATLAELRRSTSLQRVPLRGLTIDEVHRMMNVIRGQEVRWARAEAIYRQTEGNPLFVQEVLRYIVEAGQVVREGGRYVPTVDPEAGIPEGLRDVIGKRLSNLSPECNRLLTMAAVIGREFTLDALGRVAHVSEDEAVAHLEEGLHVGVLEERAQVGGVLYRFSHALFRQTLYEELSAARRIRLHQEVGRALEEIHARRLDDHAPELAEHFSHSSDPTDLAKAVDYGERAAQRAVAVHAYGEAVRLLERAIEVQEVLDPDDYARRCDLLLALGEALLPAAEPQRGYEVVAPQALKLAETLQDSARISRTCHLAITGMSRYGAATLWSTPEWRHWTELALQHAAGDSLTRVQANLAEVNRLTGAGQIRAARNLVTETLELARLLGDPDAEFECARQLLMNAPSMLFDGTEELIEVAQEFATRDRGGVAARTLARLLWAAGYVLLSWGKRTAAEQCWEAIEELAGRSGDANVVMYPLFVTAARASLAGDFEGALEAGEQFLTQGEALGAADFGRNNARNVSYRPRLRLGLANATLEDARMSAIGGIMRGLALAHLGQTDQARSALEAAMPVLLGPDAQIAVACEGLELAILLGDRTDALTLTGRLRAVHHPFWARQTELICIPRLLGDALVFLGERDEARAHYERALDVCESVRFRPEIALTRLGLAELLLDGDADEKAQAPGHLAFAIAEFEAMKMRPAFERAEALKQRLNV